MVQEMGMMVCQYLRLCCIPRRMSDWTGSRSRELEQALSTWAILVF